MAARHYAQFLDASDPDQSADDDFRIAAPPEVLRGSFTIGYIPRDDSTYGSTRYLLSVQTLLDHLAFVLEPAETDAQASVYVDGELYATVGPLVFDAGQELTFVFSGSDGTITVSGATTGNGTSEDGGSWNVVGTQLRLGGNVLGSDLARGDVSLPYAVPGATLPDPPEAGEPGAFDFSDPDNSALLTLI